MVSAEDVAQFRADGFVVLRGLLSAEETRQLRTEVHVALSSAFGDAYGRNTRTEELTDGEIAAEGNFLPLMAARTPLSLALVADDPRVMPAAEQLLGAPVVPVSPALATCMVSDTPWHNDPGTGERWVRFNAYLDAVDEDSGALRIAVGSQNASAQSDDPRVAVLATEPGDVIAFDPRALHASFGGSHRLRWCIDFAVLPPKNESARVAQTSSLVEELSSWPHPPEWPVWSDWAADASHPRRRAALDALRSLGIELNE